MVGWILEAVRANQRAAAAAVLMVFGAFLGSALIGLPPLFTVVLLLMSAAAVAAVYHWRTRRSAPRSLRAEPRILASSAVVGIAAVLLAAQAVPYGRSHSNPPTTAEPDWATPETRALVVRACFDCHSNEVDWPWYSNIAPLSWAVAKHIEDGRSKVNYSEWDRPQREADESFAEVKKGSMPPPYYTLFGLHADAILTDAERATLLEGLQATPGLAD